jgi:hypothetical protein
MTCIGPLLQDLYPLVAMNSRTYITDKKRSFSITAWSDGPIPKNRFPLFKDKRPVAPSWRWRAADLKSGLTEYRLLVQLRMDKANFKAWLAVKIGNDWAMAARLESHAHSNGLHLHAECAERGITVGMIEPPDAVTIPHWRAHHSRPNRVLSETEAWELALKFFRAQADEIGQLGI